MGVHLGDGREHRSARKGTGGQIINSKREGRKGKRGARRGHSENSKERRAGRRWVKLEKSSRSYIGEKADVLSAG